MRQSLVLSASLLLIVSLSACGQSTGRSTALPAPLAAWSVPGGGSYHAVCQGAALLPNHDRCYALLRAPLDAPSFAIDNDTCNGLQPGCYGPTALQAAYGLSNVAKTHGTGMTVAVVDAFGYPGIQNDLNEYRRAFGLPPCEAGCFSVVNQQGKTSPLPPVNSDSQDDWRPEQALDIDVVSAICPNCHIILVESENDEIPNLYASVDAAVRLKADVVSNSYGCPESSCTPEARDRHFDHRGVVITASAGDNGVGGPNLAGGGNQPCTFATVFCVGGTSLRPGKPSGFGEKVWNGLTSHMCDGFIPCATGSGCSMVVPKPSWQHDHGCSYRSETDLSAVADPETGLVVACSPCGGAPFVTGVGGTSVSSPLVAALFALGGATKNITPAKLWRRNGAGLNDVSSGRNEAPGVTYVCPTSFSYICVARVGYDGPTGWGSPRGLLDI